MSSTASRKGNKCDGALHVIELHGPSGKISLFPQDWESAKVPLSCYMALDMLCQEINEAWWWVYAPRGLLSRHECSPLTVYGP